MKVAAAQGDKASLSRETKASAPLSLSLSLSHTREVSARGGQLTLRRRRHSDSGASRSAQTTLARLFTNCLCGHRGSAKVTPSSPLLPSFLPCLAQLPSFQAVELSLEKPTVWRRCGQNIVARLGEGNKRHDGRPPPIQHCPLLSQQAGLPQAPLGFP